MRGESRAAGYAIAPNTAFAQRGKPGTAPLFSLSAFPLSAFHFLHFHFVRASNHLFKNEKNLR